MLKSLFGEVVVPDKVFQELMALSDFDMDVSVLQNADWLKVRRAAPSPLLSKLLETLDEGEAHAIALSVDLRADLLIIDERRGREAAESLRLKYTGVGGVLLRAKKASLIGNVRDFLDRIQSEAGFFISNNARAVILKAAGEQV